jgi:hypothetical protein
MNRNSIKQGQTTVNPDLDAMTKAVHPMAKVLSDQGTLTDTVRGVHTSSARRDTPSNVYGISTPGPVDKRTNAQKGSVGRADNKVNKFISRLGGHSLVMDDGNDRLLRKFKPGEGPPEYADLEKGETGGLVEFPQDESFRIRTRTGHQILMHNSEDIIYIGNAKGTTWIELTSNGKIDIFAEDSISIHTKNDLNILADRDINLEAKRNINLKAGGNTHIESFGNTEVLSGTDTKITSGKISHINSGTEHIETAGKIYMNSDSKLAVKTIKLTTFQNPTEVDGAKVESIMKRMPTHEPYPHHENLDPLSFLKGKTDREVAGAIAVPGKWKMPTISVDTFKQGKG